jgi:hypothetical protein
MTAPSTRRRKFPTSLNGGEMQDPDDVRVGETHIKAPEGFERGTARDLDAPDTGPDSGFDAGVDADERAEQGGDDDADASTRPAAGTSSSRTREPGRSTAGGDHSD